MNDYPKEPESYVGVAPHPPPNPQDQARARQTDADTESNTIAGLQSLVLKGCEALFDATKHVDSVSRQRLADIETIGKALGQLNAQTIDIIKSYQPILEDLRKPIQPRPTGAETAGDAFKHVVTEIRTLLQTAIGKNPELQEKAMGGITKIVEKGQQFMASLEGAPDKPASSTEKPSAALAKPAEPAPSVLDMSNDTMQDLQVWISELGPEWTAKFCASHRIADEGGISFGHIAEIRAAAMKKREEAKK